MLSQRQVTHHLLVSIDKVNLFARANGENLAEAARRAVHPSNGLIKLELARLAHGAQIPPSVRRRNMLSKRIMCQCK